MLQPLKLTLTDKLEPFLFNAKRFKVAIGGRAGTKSQSCIDILIHLVQQHGKRVCVFREFGSSIEDSVWSLIGDEIIRMGVPGFTITNRKIYHSSGGFFKSKGLGRDSKSVKSFSGFDIFLVEEGDFVTEEILKDLTPTLRKKGSELWLIFNPQSREDAISKRFLVPFYDKLLRDKVYEDELHYIVWTNYDENPWFPPELEAERAFDEKHLTQAEYDHKWLGHFNDNVPNAIIKAEWFDAAIDAHKVLNFEPIGVEVVAHDPSDLGPDPKGLAYRHGSVVKEAKQLELGDSNDGMDWALDFAVRNNVDLFTWDCDGMGVALHRQVRKAIGEKKIDYLMYKGSNSVDNPKELYAGVYGDKKKSKKNKETFKNKRAQKYMYVADRFFNTYLAIKKGIWCDPERMISISSEIKDIDILRSEMCRIPRKPNGNGLVQIYSKPEMVSKFKIKSPNLADSVVMSFETPTIKQRQTLDVGDKGWG